MGILIALGEPSLLAAVDPEETSRSWLPIAGYNSTYGFFAGGGFFFKKELLNSGIYGVITQNKTFKVNHTLKNEPSERWSYSINSEIGHGFEPLYGEGSQTRLEDRQDLILWRLSSRWNLDYSLTPLIKVGPVFDLRSHRSEAVPDNSLVQVLRNEDAFGMGVFQQLDLRNNTENTSYGWYQSLTVQAVPVLSQGGETRLFGLVDLNLRFFQRIADEVIFAVQLAAGEAGPDASYLFQPRLGGTQRLRGYYENRFRGRYYYVEQTELRFPVWKMIGAVVFLEFGEATNSGFGYPQTTLGFGLRIGLPPDYVAKIRIDCGFGRDQQGIFLDFGQSF